MKHDRRFKVIESVEDKYRGGKLVFTLYRKRNIFERIGYSLMFPIAVIVCIDDFIRGGDTFTIGGWWEFVRWEEITTFDTLEDAIKFKVDRYGKKEEKTYWL